jgi:hypothetical protein
MMALHVIPRSERRAVELPGGVVVYRDVGDVKYRVMQAAPYTPPLNGYSEDEMWQAVNDLTELLASFKERQTAKKVREG